MVRGRFLAVLTTALAAGCLGPTDQFSDQIHEDAKQQWATNGPSSYSYVLTRVCLCVVTDEPVKVEVQNGTIVSWTYVNSNTPLEAQYQSDFPDVPGLFEFIEDTRRGNPFYFSASYDQTYGFPATLNLNITASSAADDLQMTATEFTPIN